MFDTGGMVFAVLLSGSVIYESLLFPKESQLWLVCFVWEHRLRKDDLLLLRMQLSRWR